MLFLGYNMTGGKNVTTPGGVTLDPKCNGFTVQNIGTNDVLVNGNALVPPGGFFAIGGNYGEVYTGQLYVLFKNAATGAIEPSGSINVVQKVYTGEISLP